MLSSHSQCTVLRIDFPLDVYRACKDGKLSQPSWKRRSHECSYLEPRTLRLEGRDFTNCAKLAAFLFVIYRMKFIRAHSNKIVASNPILREFHEFYFKPLHQLYEHYPRKLNWKSHDTDLKMISMKTFKPD